MYERLKTLTWGGDLPGPPRHGTLPVLGFRTVQTTGDHFTRLTLAANQEYGR